MEPLKYLRILKRHTRVIVALTVVGFLVGFVTAPAKSKAVDTGSGDTYVATHTLIQNAKQMPFSLAQMSYFVTAGDVPTHVAEKIGGDPAEIVQQVYTTPSDKLGTLEIMATNDDPDQAVLVADTFASELVAYLAVVTQRQADSQRSALQAQLDQLNAEIVALNNPPSGSDPAVVKAQKDSAVSDYTTVQKQLGQLDSTAATQALLSLQSATATPVTAAELKARIAASTTAQEAAASSAKKSATGSTPTSIPTSTAKSRKSPSRLLRAGIGGLVGLFLALAYALIFSRLDPRVHTKEEAEEAFGTPVIAELPRLTRGQQRRTEVLSYIEPRSRTAEAFRALRSSILYLGLGRVDPEGHLGEPTPPPVDDEELTKKVVLVTSPGPSEGKTTTIANLAAVIAEAGLSVLVINCDFRRPRVHEYLGGSLNERKVIASKVTGVQVLNHVIEDGHDANPAEVVAAQREVVRKARGMFDIILLDTAPLLTTNDASELLPVADIVLLIAKASKTTFEGADRSMEVLERFGAPVIGVALVGANESPTNRYYYYYRSDEAGSERAEPGGNPLEMMQQTAPSTRQGSSPSPENRADALLADVAARQRPSADAIDPKSSSAAPDAG